MKREQKAVNRKCEPSTVEFSFPKYHPRTPVDRTELVNVTQLFIVTVVQR